MHLVVEKMVHIERPMAEVFAYVSDMERFAEWFPGVVAMAAADALAPGQPGKQYLETVRLPWRGHRQIRLQVKESRSPHFFATEGRLPPLLPRMEIALAEAAPGSCELTWRMFSRNTSPAVRYLLLPMARRVMGARAGAGVQALKLRLEAGAAVPGRSAR